MSEWKEYKLGDVLTFQRGHDLPKSKMIEGGFPVAGSNGVIGYHNTYTTLGPGLTIGRSGNIGTPHYYKHSFWAHNTVLYVKDFKGNDEIFLYYYLKTIDFTLFNTGSAVPSLNRNHVHEHEIILPPISEQQAIASVLSSLDDKIDLLHRQNVTLEKMAETLFRQWFVEEADDDWEEKSLSSIAAFLNGLACQKYPPKNEIDKLPVLKIKELRNGISKDCDWCTTEVDEKYIVENGDVIFSWSASLMVKIWNGDNCILNQHLFKVTSDKYPKWFYYLWSKYHLGQFIAIAKAHATTMGHIKRGDLDDAMVVVPTKEEIENMACHFNPIIDKLIENSKQIQTLTKLRDTLLPKLMSGEVRVEM